MKNILLLGSAGKTGITYSRLLLREGYSVFGWDKKTDFIYPNDIGSHKKFFRVTQEDFQKQTIVDKVDSITLTPGVPLQQAIIQQAKKKKKNIFSELDFCMPYLNKKGEKKQWVGITGTDGKSTLVALTNHILNHLSQNSIFCGNIGVPFSEVVLDNSKLSSRVVVAELSSYQLELAKTLMLDIAVLLNISPDHLNRYKDYDDYARTKWSIINKIKKDAGSFITSKALVKQYYVESMKTSALNMIQIDGLSSPHFYWNNRSEREYILYRRDKKTKIISSKDIKLAGEHNLSNSLFALEVAHHFLVKKPNSLNVPKNENKIWFSALKSFTPLPHRFEVIQGKYPNITYINDSKATTCQAVSNAIHNVPMGSYLFLGGQGKGEDYSVLAQDVKKKRIKLVLFGEEREQLKKSFMRVDVLIIGTFQELGEAVEVAHKHYEQDGSKRTTFLLSPVCTSWDAYQSFEERGDHFRSLVR